MNVYHKVLIKIFEITGGRDSVDVDLVDLTKKEGFYSNIDLISRQLQDEGWVALGSRANVVRITHWGTQEAKKAMAGGPGKSTELTKEANRLLAEVRELSIMVEEFSRSPASDALGAIENRITQLSDRCAKLRSSI